MECLLDPQSNHALCWPHLCLNNTIVWHSVSHWDRHQSNRRKGIHQWRQSTHVGIPVCLSQTFQLYTFGWCLSWRLALLLWHLTDRGRHLWILWQLHWRVVSSMDAGGGFLPLQPEPQRRRLQGTVALDHMNSVWYAAQQGVFIPSHCELQGTKNRSLSLCIHGDI